MVELVEERRVGKKTVPVSKMVTFEAFVIIFLANVFVVNFFLSLTVIYFYFFPKKLQRNANHFISFHFINAEAPNGIASRS